jgi:hypothetical protein
VKTGPQFNMENSNPNNDSCDHSELHTPDLSKDNIYLKGGQTMAEALQNYERNNGMNKATTSIAMRMKMNRDAVIN